MVEKTKVKKNLTCQFYRESKKKKSGPNVNKVYDTKWFAVCFYKLNILQSQT